MLFYSVAIFNTLSGESAWFSGESRNAILLFAIMLSHIGTIGPCQNTMLGHSANRAEHTVGNSLELDCLDTFSSVWAFCFFQIRPQHIYL